MAPLESAEIINWWWIRSLMWSHRAGSSIFYRRGLLTRLRHALM